MNITWSTNESGSWTTMGTNASVNNGTYYCTNVSWVDTNSHKYWWRVSLNDGCGGWDNETYSFTTVDGGNNAPVLSLASVYPTTGIDSYTTFYFNITWTDTDGDDPTDGYLKVNISKAGWNTNVSMTWFSGSNTTGAIYIKTTTLTAGSYTYSFYAYDGTDYASNTSNIGPTVNSQSYAISVSQSDTPNLWFNITALGHYNEDNVAASGQSSGTPALAIENQGNVPINLTLKINASLTVGLTLKWDDDNNPSGATTITTGEVSIEVNLAVGTTKQIWLWMDFVNVSPGTGTRTITITSSSGNW
jgi:hypothetical protein